MTWFKVDDKFHSHAKVLRIPRAVRAEAIGTWTLCGTWSADHELDGFVPDYMVEEQGGTIAGAQALVDCGLWKIARRRGGYQFVNWSEWQPARAQKVETRRAESERKAEYRARKARESAGPSGDVPTGQTRNPETPSRPVPRPDDDQDLVGHPRVPNAGDGASDDRDPIVGAIVESVSQWAQRDLHPLVVWDIVAWIDDRRGPHAKPLKNPARYYAATIRDSWAEVQQFIDTKGLAR